MKKALSIILIHLILLVPILAQQPGDACAQAKADATMEVNSTVWFGAGCLFGLLGLGAAYVIEPEPSATSLLGKSPDYVAHYTDCYKESGKNIQTKKAMNGCLIGTGVQVLGYVLVAVAAESVD